ncbi:SMI1/KNR4 family protein [Actinocorallia herbida]|uniref:SMI1/KNR4 family protein n=1 Tax=Actinocorallia herbida TaxID=58109 RepID=UPI0011CD728B|nr:SMI1/KNR4 family protein [Actinocorallia herbida]
MQRIADAVRVRDGAGALVGVGEEEILAVMADQGLGRLPGAYREFLALMGRRAGRLLAGTDAFHPAIFGLKKSAPELSEGTAFEGIPPGALVFAMHQGYQVYWMEDVSADDPKVFFYQEGDDGIAREWESFTEFLNAEFGDGGALVSLVEAAVTGFVTMEMADGIAREYPEVVGSVVGWIRDAAAAGNWRRVERLANLAAPLAPPGLGAELCGILEADPVGLGVEDELGFDEARMPE